MSAAASESSAVPHGPGVGVPRPDVAVVVPAFNEAGAIGDVVDELLPFGYRIIVVDDGSTDRTVAQVLGRPVVLVPHLINRGQGSALQTGISMALSLGARVIVTFDADGQHGAADIPRLIEPIESGRCDVVLGSRFLGRAEGIPAARRWLLRAAVWFTRATAGLPVSDTHNGLRAFSRAAASRLRIRMDGMAHASEILDEIREHGWRWTEVPVTIRYSPYSIAKGQASSESLRIAAQVLISKAMR